MRERHRTRLHSDDHDARVVMPAAAAARTEYVLLDSDVGRTFRLELDPVAVLMNCLVQVPGDERWLPHESERRVGCESHGRERSHHQNPDSRGSPLPLLRTQYAQDFLL